MINLRKRVYRYLIDSDYRVSLKFKEYIQSGGRSHSIVEKALTIIRLNWIYRICRAPLYTPMEKLRLPEAGISEGASVSEMVDRLKAYDIISFDVFYTLIFRTVEIPTDVFRLMEAKSGIFGFAGLRMEAEKNSRVNGGETTLDEIYSLLSQRIGIDKTEFLRREIDTEKSVCVANLYIQEVYRELVKLGKTIVAVSDMYLPSSVIAEILKNCGYDIENIFVSCEHGVSKSDGALQRLVADRFGVDKSYIHIGDNVESDIRGSEKAGWSVCHYPNIVYRGWEYRCSQMKSLAASFYRGLANIRLHSGSYKSSGFYEYGYAYGGVMAMGFCSYISKIVCDEGVDLLVFLGRDMYTVHKAYAEYFDSNACDAVYIPFSRFAAYQLSMGRNLREFFDNVIRHWIHNEHKLTVGDVLERALLDDLKPFLSEVGLSENGIFSASSADKLWMLFESHRDRLIVGSMEQMALAGEHFDKLIGEHKNVRVIDLGWSGTCPLLICDFIRNIRKKDIRISGILMAMIDREETRAAVSSGLLEAYMFSPLHNLDALNSHVGCVADIDYRNMLLELMFTQDAPSLLKYRRDDDGKVGYVFSVDEENGDIIREIQKGILDFCDDYYEYFLKRFPDIAPVSGREAYMPIDALAAAKKYCIQLFKDYRVSEQSGDLRPEDFHTLREIYG